MVTKQIKDTILSCDRAVPRYTSYPTAPHFMPINGTAANPYENISSDETVSLYIHIPFCQKMCWYCGCHTKVTRKYDPIANYLHDLIKEIRLVSQAAGRRLSVSHVHFGGGSPGMLSAEDFRKIIDTLKSEFFITPDAEIAIELDPRGIAEDRIAAYALCGVNRVSLGAQDFNDQVMESVNRAQPYDLSHQAVTTLRNYGIQHINLDMMYGLPHQTVDTIKHSMNLALALSPDRIAYFGYAHVPWMKKHMRLIDSSSLPDKSLRLDLFLAGATILEQNGYNPVGIDHFVKPHDSMALALRNGTLRRNFQGYTTDQSRTMIGLGVSSIGKTTAGYWQNFSDMPLYHQAIENNRLPLAKFCQITDQDITRGNIIERLMCDFRVDLKNYQGDFSTELGQIKAYEAMGFVTITDKVIAIVPEARPMARVICSIFDEYLPPETIQRHSKAV